MIIWIGRICNGLVVVLSLMASTSATQALQTQAAYLNSNAPHTSNTPHNGVFFIPSEQLTIASNAPTANVDILVPSNDHDVDAASSATLSHAITQATQLAAAKTPKASVGVWTDSSPAPRWITAAALAAGMGWGWKARWMVRDLTTAPGHEDNSGSGSEAEVDIRVVTTPLGEVNIPYLDKSWEYALAQSDESTVRAAAFKGDIPIGIVTVFIHGDTSALFDLGVVEKERGRGVGLALVRYACGVAAARGARSVTLNSTVAGGSVYERAGFRDLGEGQTFWFTPGRLGVEASDEERRMVQAVVEDNAGMVASLGGFGDLDRELACGLTLVEVGAKVRSEGAVEALVELGATLDVLSAWDLGWKERADKVARSFGVGIDVVDEREEVKSALLHQAVARNDAELVEMLLHAGARTDVKDGRFGSTPERWAKACKSDKAGEALENFLAGR